jgi:hypothetical protein
MRREVLHCSRIGPKLWKFFDQGRLGLPTESLLEDADVGKLTSASVKYVRFITSCFAEA